MSEASANPFAALPSDAEGHFRFYVYAVVARMLANLEASGAAAESGDNLLSAFPFVAGYRAGLRAFEPDELALDDRVQWWDAQLAAWELGTAGRLPLRALIEAGGVGREQVRLMVAAGLVEEDIRFGALFAALQEPLVARRPCIGLLNWLLADPPSGATGPGATGPSHVAGGASWSASRELLERGLLLAENRDEPRSEWILRVPSSLWDAARGRVAERPAPGLVHQPASVFPELDALILPPELRGQVAHLPLLLNRAEDANDRLSAVIVRGMQGAGRRTVLGAIARALGRDVLLLDATRPSKDEGGAQRGAASDDGANRVRVSEEAWRLLGPLATLMGALPVVRLDPAPGETLDLRPLVGYQGPVGITLGRSGGLAGPLVEQALSLTLPPPDRPARAQFWEAALGRHTNGHRSGVAPGEPPGISEELSGGLQQPVVAGEIIDSFLLTGGHIHRAARLARAHAALAGRTDLDVDDVRQATRSLNRQVLETLATHLPARGGWHELIVSPATSRELTALETRCRQREQLREQAGPAFDRSLNRGVRALFTGPSGTGKTLAAASLAAALGMDLYRVDLAAVVNKYIGETERNLNQVLSRAEELDVVLLLDEGDALMTRRTDVRNANDRYANLETNYLLQRLEIYEGIAIITTNAGQRIDTAFLRRLDVIVDFTPPDATERWQIWQAHLPVDHEVSPALLDEIAARCALTGGQIRNAALHATLLAGGSAVAVGDEHVEAALQREYRKAGAAYPMSGRTDGPDRGHMGRLRRYAGVAG